MATLSYAHRREIPKFGFMRLRCLAVRKLMMVRLFLS